MPNFLGQLNANEVFAAIYNMIISQQVFANNLGKHQTLVDKARVDGGMYGDSKLYYSTDCLESEPWGGDSEAGNLLAVKRPPAPECQVITLSVFRQITVTVDNYLTKRAWADEYAFTEFNGVVLSWITDTKKIYDGTLYNAFIGTNETSVGKQMRSVDLTTALSGLSGIEKDRKEAEEIARSIADLFIEMNDYTRDFNDYQNMRSYDDAEIKIIWNAKYVNKIRYIDLPTVFHNEDLKNKFSEDILRDKYFGVVLTSSNISSYSASTPTTGKPITTTTGVYVPGTNNANGCVRSLVEKRYTVSGTSYHVFPGEEIHAGATVGVAGANFAYGEVYIEQDDILCKIVVEYPPYMSAFEVGTSFFNAKALNENHYNTWGHNKLEHLKDKPFITIKVV